MDSAPLGPELGGRGWGQAGEMAGEVARDGGKEGVQDQGEWESRKLSESGIHSKAVERG